VFTVPYLTVCAITMCLVSSQCQQTSTHQYEPLVGALTDYCIKDMGMMLKTSALANISGRLVAHETP
jgi:hypothetical protein